MWTEKTGVLQTELEALIEDKPEEMERMARDAIAPFYDPTLAERVTRARERWEREAQALIDARTADDHELASLRADALAAARLYRESDPKPVIAQLARQLNVHPEALPNWIRQDDADRGEPHDPPTTEMLEENRRLRAEVKELRAARNAGYKN